MSLSTSESSRAERNRYSGLLSSVHPRLLGEVWEDWRRVEGWRGWGVVKRRIKRRISEDTEQYGESL